MAVRELPLPHGFFLLRSGLCLAGAPGAVRDLVAPPGAPRVVPRLHHDGMLGTPPRLQAARDQPGPHDRLDKRGPASFRDHVQTHLVCSQPLLIAWVIEEDPELAVKPAPVCVTVSKKSLHSRSPFPGHGWLKDWAVGKLPLPTAARGLKKQSSQRTVVVFHTFLISSHSSSLTLRAFHARMISLN